MSILIDKDTKVICQGFLDDAQGACQPFAVAEVAVKAVEVI